jgi:hypothetical protein
MFALRALDGAACAFPQTEETGTQMDTPDVLAIERVLQCIALAGIVSSVFVTTSVIFSTSILRGAPRRGSSSRPSKRFLANRFSP